MEIDATPAEINRFHTVRYGPQGCISRFGRKTFTERTATAVARTLPARETGPPCSTACSSRDSGRARPCGETRMAARTGGGASVGVGLAWVDVGNNKSRRNTTVGGRRGGHAERATVNVAGSHAGTRRGVLRFSYDRRRVFPFLYTLAAII